jgi:hypothetical protein
VTITIIKIPASRVASVLNSNMVGLPPWFANIVIKTSLGYTRQVGRKRIHDEALGERLLDEAAARIAEHGLDGLSLRSVASAAGTTTAAIYTIFGGKPGLLAAMHRRVFTRLGELQR